MRTPRGERRVKVGYLNPRLCIHAGAYRSILALYHHLTHAYSCHRIRAIRPVTDPANVSYKPLFLP